MECRVTAGDDAKTDFRSIVVYTVNIKADSKSVAEGDSASLECNIIPSNVNNRLNIVWCRNGQEITSNNGELFWCFLILQHYDTYRDLFICLFVCLLQYM